MVDESNDQLRPNLHSTLKTEAGEPSSRVKATERTPKEGGGEDDKC